MVASGEIWNNLTISLVRVFTGFGIGLLGGLALGSVMGLSPTGRDYLYPLFKAFAQVPVIGWLPLLGNNARGVIVTQVYPNERAVTYAMVKEAQELARAKGLQEISPAMLGGFAAAKVLVEGLKRAGPKPSRDKLHGALEGIKKFDLGGLEASYGPDDHTGLDFADLSIIGTDGRFRR